MVRLPFLNNTRLSKFGQVPKNPNREILNLARFHDFPLSKIRQALFTLNEIPINDLTDGNGISYSVLTKTLRGDRRNPEAMDILARALGLKRSEIFPPNEKRSRE